jgi:uncharacterized protein
MENYCFSKYNKFLKTRDGVVGLNLHNKNLFAIDRKNYDLLLAYKSKLNQLQTNWPDLFSTMYKLGIIEDKNTDIPSILLMKNREEVYSNKSYHFIINPTLNCNFSCWYCYETHNKKKMNKETIQNLIKFIGKLVEKEKISNLKIDWFGGEPLLCFESVMKPVCIEVKKLCEQHHVFLHMSITTNGFFLKENMISFFKEYNFRGFQITIDGNKELHDKTRFLSDKSGSYDVIVRNINMLVSGMDGIELLLRINYVKEYLDDCIDIIDSFPKDLRSKILVALVQVWQNRDINTDEDRKLISRKEVKLQNLFSKAGFKVRRTRFNCWANHSCYADLKNEAIINYDARVFKCTTANFEATKEDGILTSDGEIVWDDVAISKRIGRATFDNKICLKCDYLPLCGGGCSTHPVTERMNNGKCTIKPRVKISVFEVMKFFAKTNYKMGHINKIQQLMS